MSYMNIIEVQTVAQWRAWLAEHHSTSDEVWLVIQHKDSPSPSPRYSEAIEQALCFGWIDGLHRKRDADSSQLRFSPRKTRSGWSAVNRERAARMIASGQMTAAGSAFINRAKSDKTWAVDATMPADLADAMNAHPLAHNNFEKFPPSSKRLILEWVATAKRQETRSRRITQAVELAAQNIRANHRGT